MHDPPASCRGKQGCCIPGIPTLSRAPAPSVHRDHWQLRCDRPELSLPSEGAGAGLGGRRWPDWEWRARIMPCPARTEEATPMLQGIHKRSGSGRNPWAGTSPSLVKPAWLWIEAWMGREGAGALFNRGQVGKAGAGALQKGGRSSRRSRACSAAAGWGVLCAPPRAGGTGQLGLGTGVPALAERGSAILLDARRPEHRARMHQPGTCPMPQVGMQAVFPGGARAFTPTPRALHSVCPLACPAGTAEGLGHGKAG